MQIAAMHSVQSGCRFHLLNMFSLVDGRREVVLLTPSSEQTTGQAEPKMTTGLQYYKLQCLKEMPGGGAKKEKDVLAGKCTGFVTGG